MRKIDLSDLETPADVFKLLAYRREGTLPSYVKDYLQGKCCEGDDDYIETLLNYVKENNQQEAEDFLETIDKAIERGFSYYQSFTSQVDISQRKTNVFIRDVLQNSHELLFPNLAHESYITHREKVYSEYVAREAAKNPKVVQFRHMYLRDKPEFLTKKQAVSFLSSPAYQVLSREFFETKGIPFLSHVAGRIERVTDEKSNRVYETLMITPLGRTFTVNEVQDDITSITYFFNETTYDVKTEKAFPQLWQDRMHVPFIRGGAAIGDYIQMDIWPHSIIAELKLIGHELETLFSWTEFEAMLFVLTDTAPLLRALKVTSNFWPVSQETGHRIILNIQVEPWIPAETISTLYREFQHGLFGRFNYQIGERTLALLQFGLRHDVDRKKSPQWNELVKEWNSKSPLKWHYKGGKRLASAYSRAKQIYEKQLELSMNWKTSK